MKPIRNIEDEREELNKISQATKDIGHELKESICNELFGFVPDSLNRNQRRLIKKKYGKDYYELINMVELTK